MNIIAMIPARIGSTRLKMKNFALINGHPMISYAIKAACDSNMFSRVIVNSDSPLFEVTAKKYGAEFYLRPEHLGSSTTKSDEVVMDFMNRFPCDIVTWVNPTSPLQTGEEVRNVVEYFQSENLDSLITVKNEQVHCLYQGTPLNFVMDEIFAQTQDLVPVQPFVYSVMMWRCSSFLNKMKNEGHAIFCGKTGFYPVSKESSIIIKTKEDIMLADFIMRIKASEGAYQVQYDEIVEHVKG